MLGLPRPRPSDHVPRPEQIVEENVGLISGELAARADDAARPEAVGVAMRASANATGLPKRIQPADLFDALARDVP